MLIKFAEKDTTGPSISDLEGETGDLFIDWALGIIQAEEDTGW